MALEGLFLKQAFNYQVLNSQPAVAEAEFTPFGRKNKNKNTETRHTAFSQLREKTSHQSMANSSTVVFIAICAATVLVAMSRSPTAVAGGDHHVGLGWAPTCKGTVAECLGGEEFELDSEINRRILATTKYISYGALQRNTVPCSRRGASYYNCRPGAQANPYSRGCSAITRCRS
ncbi:hypothetical protein RJT34_22976 [Clitoria ternatea]|uniref:Uncharacterized protein n=1 Tax=Clitoria ternatea TaxID=43366 RepID=A0AAN9FKT6_CLITE